MRRGEKEEVRKRTSFGSQKAYCIDSEYMGRIMEPLSLSSLVLSLSLSPSFFHFLIFHQFSFLSSLSIPLHFLPIMSLASSQYAFRRRLYDEEPQHTHNTGKKDYHGIKRGEEIVKRNPLEK